MNRNGYGGGPPPTSAPPAEFDDYSDATAFFEKGRIEQLRGERVVIQKKTFTKWCNSFLNKVRLFPLSTRAFL